MDMGAAGIRAARAGVFTALCVLVSSGAHVMLSGAPVPLTTLLMVTAGVFLVAFALAGKERGYPRIAALLIPLELAADTVFTTGQHACYGHSGGPVTGPLRSVGLDLVCGGGNLGTPLARMAAGREGAAGAPVDLAAQTAATPWLLLAAHVSVGLLAAAWLRRGEAALARLLRAAAATAFRPLRVAFAVRPAEAGPAVRPKPATPTARPSLALPLLSHSVHRRGPPALVLTA